MVIISGVHVQGSFKKFRAGQEENIATWNKCTSPTDINTTHTVLLHGWSTGNVSALLSSSSSSLYHWHLVNQPVSQ